MENISENKSTEKRKLTLGKEERLCSKKIIEKIFSEGESFLSFPLKVTYIETELPSNYPAQAAFTVGKKNFKLAVNRNRIKRIMRESYRLNKFALYDKLHGKQLAVFFIFIGKKIPDFGTVDLAMKKGIDKLITGAIKDN